jgi:CRISPR/Cas system-associated protein Csm6
MNNKKKEIIILHNKGLKNESIALAVETSRAYVAHVVYNYNRLIKHSISTTVKLPPIQLAPEMDVDVAELIRQAQGVELFDGVRSSVIAVRTLTPRIEPLPDGRERVIYQSVMNY